MHRRYVAWLAALAAIGVLYGATLPEDKRSMLHSAGVLHPWVHLAIFGTIALLASWSVRSASARVVLCVGVALLGCLTEVVEWHLYHAPLEWTDMVLDAMGAVIGTSLATLAASLQRQVFFRLRR